MVIIFLPLVYNQRGALANFSFGAHHPLILFISIDIHESRP